MAQIREQNKTPEKELKETDETRELNETDR